MHSFYQIISNSSIFQGTILYLGSVNLQHE